MFGIRKLSNNKKINEITADLFVAREFPNLDCNIYILKHSDTSGKSSKTYELTLIDAGNGLNTSNLIEGMKASGFNPKNITRIIITHEHLDHILGVYNIPEIAVTKPEIYAFGITKDALNNGDEDVIAPRMLGIRPSVFGVDIKPLNVKNIKGGTVMDVGAFNFEFIYTPGHSLGSVSIYETSQKILFPGDVVFCGGSFGRFDFPGGSLTELRNSIKKLMELDVKIICPGHMNYSMSGNEEIRKADRVINSFY